MLSNKLLGRGDLQNVRAMYKEMLESQHRRIYVCAGTGCVASGSLEIYAEFERLLSERRLPYVVKLEKEAGENTIALKKNSCPGFCQKGPLVRIDPEGWMYTKVRPEDCAEILEKSPTALALAKRSFNTDTAHIAGISALGLQAVSLFYGTEESQEGVRAFQEKRKPRFRER